MINSCQSIRIYYNSSILASLGFDSNVYVLLYCTTLKFMMVEFSVIPKARCFGCGGG